MLTQSIVAAIMVFGDTRHNANQTYNYGSGSGIDGFFPRNATQLANLQPYAGIMRNWCVDSDPICAANQTTHNEGDHLDYFNVDSQSAASFIRSVASLTETDTAFSTAIPTSLSGTVQDYATIGTATPSGSVSTDATWTSSTSYAACTATSYSRAYSTTNATISSSMSTTTQSGTVTASVASVFPLTATSSELAEATGSGSASPSGSGGSASAALPADMGGFLSVLAAGTFLGMVFL